MTEAMKRKKLGMANLEGHASLSRWSSPRRNRAGPMCSPKLKQRSHAMAIFLTAFGAFSLGMYQVGHGINT